MSTRCQVKITQSGLSWERQVMLYHHCDGYPENMMPLIRKAYAEGIKPVDHGSWKSNEAWSMGRTGHTAAMLCHIDPRGFEPESGMELHGDIEYLYEIKLVNHAGGSMAEVPTWEVQYHDSEGNLVEEEIGCAQVA